MKLKFEVRRLPVRVTIPTPVCGADGDGMTVRLCARVGTQVMHSHLSSSLERSPPSSRRLRIRSRAQPPTLLFPGRDPCGPSEPFPIHRKCVLCTVSELRPAWVLGRPACDAFGLMAGSFLQGLNAERSTWHRRLVSKAIASEHW